MKQKLQNDEFLSYAQKYFKLLKNWTDQGMREIFNGREKLFVLSYTKIDKVEIFHVLHRKVELLTRRHSEQGTRNRQ